MRGGETRRVSASRSATAAAVELVDRNVPDDIFCANLRVLSAVLDFSTTNVRRVVKTPSAGATNLDDDYVVADGILFSCVFDCHDQFPFCVWRSMTVCRALTYCGDDSKKNGGGWQDAAQQKRGPKPSGVGVAAVY